MGEHATLVEQSYSIIREDIIYGNLDPNSPLRIEHLKGNYSVGASPLREALSRLLTDGLVTNEGLRGFRVAPISLADLRDITDSRLVVETSALRLAVERGDARWEGNLVAAHYHLSRLSERQNMDSRDFMIEMERLNREFHLILIEGSKSAHLVRICMQLFDFSRRYRNISLRGNPARPHEVNDEHDAIHQAVLRRDADTAVRLITEHIEGTYRSVSKAFEGDISFQAEVRGRVGTNKIRGGAATKRII